MDDVINKIRTTTGDKQINYEALANIPQIAGVALSGNKTLDELDVQSKSKNVKIEYLEDSKTLKITSAQ